MGSAGPVRFLICSLGIAAGLWGEVEMQVRNGHPIVNGVYVNGRGPYRFLIDTGTSVNLIEAKLARSIGLTASFRTELVTSTGMTIAAGSDGIDVRLDSVKAEGQKFVFLAFDAFRDCCPDIRGVLGQEFLSRVDYMLDVRGRRLAFGKQNDPSGTRARTRTINGRLAIATSLGDLILDSGADRLVLFGVAPDTASSETREMRTVTGSREIGMAFSKPLTIEGRNIWRGDAVAIPKRGELGVEGLLPLSLFKSVYVCNSEGYVIFQ